MYPSSARLQRSLPSLSRRTSARFERRFAAVPLLFATAKYVHIFCNVHIAIRFVNIIVSGLEMPPGVAQIGVMFGWWRGRRCRYCRSCGYAAVDSCERPRRRSLFRPICLPALPVQYTTVPGFIHCFISQTDDDFRPGTVLQLKLYSPGSTSHPLLVELLTTILCIVVRL